MKTNEVFEFLLDCCPVKPNLSRKNHAEEIEQGLTTLSYGNWSLQKVTYIATFYGRLKWNEVPLQYRSSLSKVSYLFFRTGSPCKEVQLLF